MNYSIWKKTLKAIGIMRYHGIERVSYRLHQRR